MAIEDTYADVSAKGIDVFDEIAIFIRAKFTRNGEPTEEYERGYHVHRNKLGHYFRFTYHIVGTVVDRFDDDETRYKYLKLLRAQLSNSEQVLIALNCAYGEGQGTFKNWVEQFALLHNIDQSDRDELGLDEVFAPGAFEYAK